MLEYIITFYKLFFKKANDLSDFLIDFMDFETVQKWRAVFEKSLFGAKEHTTYISFNCKSEKIGRTENITVTVNSPVSVLINRQVDESTVFVHVHVAAQLTFLLSGCCENTHTLLKYFKVK